MKKWLVWIIAFMFIIATINIQSKASTVKASTIIEENKVKVNPGVSEVEIALDKKDTI